MLGGIARRQSAIAQIREKTPNLIVLHNGNLLREFGRQQELKRQVQVKDLNRIGVDLFGVGVGDFILGADSLRTFKRKARFPLVASNLTDSTGQLTFSKEWKKKISLAKGPLTIRAFSLFSKKGEQEILNVFPTVKIDPIKDQIEKWREEKKEKEFWILLFHGPSYEAQQLARYETLFDLIVYSYRGDVPYYQKVRKTNFVSTGAKGRYFITLTFENEPPFKAKKVNRVTLNKEHSDAKEGLQLISNYKLKLKKKKVAQNYPKVSWPNEETYVGSQACAVCHEAEYNVWKDSKHAHALDQLVPENHHWDPECLVCHTTGFQFKGGFVDLKKSKVLGNVGCEMCHGPGSLHVKAPLENKGVAPSSATCLQCHDADNSPKFEWESYWPKIKH